MSENVLLGYKDKPVPSTEESSFTSNYLGKLPDVIKLPVCLKCGQVCHFVLQIYCPIDDYHRTLYVFLCVACKKFLILRKLRVYEQSDQEEGEECAFAEDDDWGEENNEKDDWGDANDSAECNNEKWETNKSASIIDWKI